MPRSQRIEYEHACYHVMNRGCARQLIFHDAQYYQAFLTTLGEAHQRFDCIFHAYCLMGNHYHLLIETPNSNLGRIMRHINGVYTQRYNKLKRTDGPLFRGRYKAILVEKDAYLLHLSRYIHRNPIDMKRPLVARLEDYPWSSYLAYIGKAKHVKWIEREKTYQLLGHKQKYQGYNAFVLQGNEQHITDFYGKRNIASVLSGQAYKNWLYDTLLPEISEKDKCKILKPDLTIRALSASVALFYGCVLIDLRKVVKDPSKGHEGRKVAMYLCQEILDARLGDIAAFFNLGHNGSVSFICHQIRTRRLNDKLFSKKVQEIIEGVMKQLT